MATTLQLQRVNRWLSSLGTVYALVAVMYFFVNLASNAGRPVRELLPSMLLSLALAVSGYLVLLVATWLASDRRVQIANTTVTVLSLFIAVPLYAGAFHPAQDGEFMAAFVLVGLPTIVVALILLIFGLLARARGRLPSNPAFASGPPSAAAQRER